MPRRRRNQDFTGRTIGKYTVVRLSRRAKHSHWLCRCECGAERDVRSDALVAGRQCECVARKQAAEKNKTHGMTGSPEYRTWGAMLQRCHNPNSDRYADWGGRGVKVCDRWRESFEAFYADVGPRPSPRHSLDRFPDKNGNYEPGNVRWATPREQQQNMRSNRLVEFRGETLCLSEWARRFGMKRGTLRRRLDWGWSAEDALTLPLQKRRTAAKETQDAV
jgi:hypothetical protein